MSACGAADSGRDTIAGARRLTWSDANSSAAVAKITASGIDNLPSVPFIVHLLARRKSIWRASAREGRAGGLSTRDAPASHQLDSFPDVGCNVWPSVRENECARTRQSSIEPSTKCDGSNLPALSQVDAKVE
jgi:hypothetical protein